MRKYWIIFILATTVCLAGLGELIYVNFLSPRVLVFDIGRMREESSAVPDSVLKFQIDAIYPANKLNNSTDTVFWADVYLCTSFSKEDSLSGNTKFMLLDIKTKSGLGDIKYPYDYSAALKAEIFKKCRVKIPPGMVNDITGYKYRLADVKLEYTATD